ncbi:MAG: sigma-70 family RNA polymerase sigma factor [Planctomycetes bacterium]|nr:sigma-70 family RNA polymerase sigma factor [Planctomycetota bacterium]
MATGAGDDRALLERWCEGRDEQAFADLVERHRSMVEAVCRRELPGPGEVDDVVQEVFIALADEAGSIRGAPGSWLRTVALHRCLNHLRARQRRRLHEGRVAVGEVAPEPPAAGDAEELVAVCLAELGEDERDLLVQLFFLGLSQAEVARRSQQPPLVVHRRSQRALSSLRQRFARRGHRIGLAALALLLAGGNQALAATVAVGGGATVAVLVAGLGVAALVPAIILGAHVRAQGQAASASPEVPGTPPAQVVPLRGSPGVQDDGAAARAAGAGAVRGEPAGRPQPPAHPGFTSRFLVADVLLGELANLPTRSLHQLGAPLAACPGAQVVAIDAPASLPATAWWLPAAAGRVRLLTPAMPDRPGGGREMTSIISSQRPPRVDRWLVSHQVVVDDHARGILLMVAEQQFSRTGPEEEVRRRWSWYGQDQVLASGFKPTLIFGRDGDILVLDAGWRDLDPGECARWVGQSPRDGEPGVEQ